MGNVLGIDITFEHVIADVHSQNRAEWHDGIEMPEDMVQVNMRDLNNSLPIIQEKPDLKHLMASEFYKRTKCSVGLPPTNKTPNDNFNMFLAVRKREHGLASPGLCSFSANQQRGIANLFIPNKKEQRIISLPSKVFICQFDKSGDILLTACQLGVFRMYDSSKGVYRFKHRIKAKNIFWGVNDAHISPCGQFFAYATWHKSFMILPVNGSENECVHININNHYERFGIFCLRYSPCSRKLVGGSNRSSIYLADIERQTAQETGKNRCIPNCDVNAITYISETDPNLIVSGDDIGSVRLFDLRCDHRHNLVSVFSGHYDGITYLDPRNDGYHVLSNSKDQSIKIWDIRKPSPRIRNQHIESTAWDYRWDTIPQNFYGPIRPLANDTSVMTYRGHTVSKTLLRAKFSPAQQTGQRYIYTGCATGRLIIYDVLTGEIKQAIEGHRNVIRDLDWHPRRSEIVTGSWDTRVNLNSFQHNVSTYQVTEDFEIHSSSQDVHPPLRRSRRLEMRHEIPEIDQNIQSSSSSSSDDDELQQDEEGLLFTS